MITASIRRAADGRSYRVEFPYDRTVVEAIKRIVPAHSRTYDPDEKSWYVSPAYRDIIRQLLEDIFVDVETGSADMPDGGDPYRVLYLLPTAPREVVEASYKALSKLHHPDAGGDLRQMQSINQAVFRIRRQLA